MNSEIISVLNALCEKLGIAVDWTAENIMPYAEQLIRQYARYLLVNIIVGLCAYVLVSAVCVYVIKRLVKWTHIRDKNGDSVDWDRADCIGFPVVILSVVLVICAIGSAFCIRDLIKALSIPEIYAAQELIGMISSL